MNLNLKISDCFVLLYELNGTSVRFLNKPSSSVSACEELLMKFPSFF